MVRPDSHILHPSGLVNEPIALGFHASSHYIALRLMEGFLTRDQIKIEHHGGPRARYDAVLAGRATAAVLQEPWIAMADKAGWHNLCEAHFLGTDIAVDDMDQNDFDAINKALVKAVKLFNSDKRRFVHYLIEEIEKLPNSPEYPKITPEDFYLPRLRYVDPQPYPKEFFENTYKWMKSWGLISGDVDWDMVVNNRVASAEITINR